MIRLTATETELLELAAQLGRSGQFISYSSLHGERTRAAQFLCRIGLLARRRSGYGTTIKGTECLAYNPGSAEQK